MLISLLTCGTRGDTQPMTVLGHELQRRGHRVRIAASPNTLDLPRRAGLEAFPLGPDSQLLMESETGRRWLASGNVRAFMKELSAMVRANFDTARVEAMDACEAADVLVAGALAEDITAAVAEGRGVPLVTLHSVPIRRNPHYAAPLVTTRRLPGPLNTLTGAVYDEVFWRGTRKDVDALRSELGVPASTRPLGRVRPVAGDLELQAYDAALLPRLRTSADRPIVGFLTIDAELRRVLGESGVHEHLHAWLDAGPPPVFFGFGSMPVEDPAATVGLISDVARTLGVRALVSAGWGRLSALEPDSDDVRVVGSFNHDLVLPRCRAAVHHGGAGTLAASLRAGLPTVVCSVFADQPFWGTRVEELGCGSHLRFKDLDHASLEGALREALTTDTTRRAEQLGGRLRPASDAVREAADLLEARFS